MSESLVAGAHSAESGHADSVRTLIEAWEHMVERLEGHSISRGDGMAVLFANRELSFFNMLVFETPLADLEAVRAGFRRARVRADECPHPALLAFTPDWMAPGWEQVAAEEGLELATNMIAMVADDLLPPVRPLPQVRLAVVDDLTTARDIMLMNAHAYGLPDESVESVSGLEFWKDKSWGVVGYVDDRPASATAAFLVNDMIYIAMVATDPDFQRKGIAEAVMRHAIALAQDSCGKRPIWLHATDRGRPVYAAMGFSPRASTPAYAFGGDSH